MAVVYSPDVVEIAVIQTVGGRPAVNVWHMRHLPEWSGDANELMVRDFADNWQDHVLDMQTSSVQLLGFEWRSLDQSDATVGAMEPSSGKPTQGQITAEGAPPNVATLINKRTNNRPRGARDGRMFLAGAPEDAINPSGQWTPAMLTSLQSNIDAFYDGISDSGWNAAGDRYPVVLETTAASRQPGTQSVTIQSRRVTSLSVDPLVSTQRDRLR